MTKLDFFDAVLNRLARAEHGYSLEVNQAIVKTFDGVRVLEPWVVYLKPMHEDPELSWFETTGRAADAAEAVPSRRGRPTWRRRLQQALARPRSALRWPRRRPHVQVHDGGPARTSGS